MRPGKINIKRSRSRASSSHFHISAVWRVSVNTPARPGDLVTASDTFTHSQAVIIPEEAMRV